MSTGVTILWWPEEGVRLLRLRDDHVPRLVIIKGNALPPFPLDWNEEEWLRSPFPPEQLDHSLAQLAARVERTPPPPEMKTGDVLSFCEQSVGLSAREAILASVLTTAFNQVVPYAALYTAVGLDPAHDENAFLGLIARLRRHLDPLGLEIHAARRIGYVMRTAAGHKVLSSA